MENVHTKSIKQKLSFVILFQTITDRCKTQRGSRIVEEIQLMFVEYLQEILEEHQPSRAHLFGKILLFLTDMRTYTAYFDYYLPEMYKTFRHAVPVSADTLSLTSGEGLAHEPSFPSCDDAPPAKRVKELLTGNSLNVDMKDLQLGAGLEMEI